MDDFTPRHGEANDTKLLLAAVGVVLNHDRKTLTGEIANILRSAFDAADGYL
jgi:hypothetical protein